MGLDWGLEARVRHAVALTPNAWRPSALLLLARRQTRESRLIVMSRDLLRQRQLSRRIQRSRPLRNQIQVRREPLPRILFSAATAHPPVATTTTLRNRSLRRCHVPLPYYARSPVRLAERHPLQRDVLIRMESRGPRDRHRSQRARRLGSREHALLTRDG